MSDTTKYVAAARIGIEVDTENGNIILNLDGDRYELEMDGRNQWRLGRAVDWSARRQREAAERARKADDEDA